MSQPSLKQWDEDRKTLGVVYDLSRAKPVERKNTIKNSRQAAFKSALAERTKPSGQHQDTKTNTSGSSLGKEQCGAQARRDEASSHRGKKPHHMIQLFIKTSINRKNLCLRVDRNTTVSALKDIIHRKLGIRPALQNLYTNNQRFKLCDALTLLDLGIKPNTNIDLTLDTSLLGGAPTLDETFLQTLAFDLAKDWQQLAEKLTFRPAQTCNFERLAESNPEVQAYQMLVSWWEEQADHREAEERLRSALVQIGRRDLAARIPGYAATSPGNRTQSSEHQSISDASGINEKQSGSVEKKHKPEHTVHPGIASKYEADKTQTEYKKTPLKSYGDIISFDKKRILITAESGHGKSTLLKKIAYDWAVSRSDDAHQNEESPLSKYELVFLLEINKMKGNLNIMDEIFTQKLLPQNQFGKKDLENYVIQNPEKVLILLDGVDERLQC